MIVTCPNCSTHFSVPDAAFGAGGRTLRCARCAHKWRAEPPPRMEEIPLESPPLARRAAEEEDQAVERMLADARLSPDLPAADLGIPSIEAEGAGPVEEGGEEDTFAKISELMMARTPDTIPDVFVSAGPKPAPRRKGAALLLLAALVVLLSLGAGLFYLQDRVIALWPPAAGLYEKAGLRHDVVGAGLSFRNYNSERMVEDDKEVLIVRGVIANSTRQSREIPLLRLALYNNGTLLQEKIINPPQPALDAHATVGFRITLEQPDANATKFEVTFVAPKPAQN